MDHAVEVGQGGMKYVPYVITIGSGVHMSLVGGGRMHTDRHQTDIISLFFSKIRISG
jgi:hypothetical protein